jgi:hypothetical protein
MSDREETGSWIFSWAMSHTCANDEYRPQVGFSFHLQIF